MSKTTSPTHFSGDSDHFYDANFTAEISQKMRVPKRIKVDGESDEPVINGPNHNNWMPAEKLEMHVPEKIVVLDEQVSKLYYGHDTHYGTKALPREMELENAIMPPDPGIIRVQTPPRVITLDKHYYPTAEEYQPPPYMEPLRPARVFDELPDRRLDVSQGNMTMGDASMSEGMSTSEEVVHLRRQLAKLNRRVMTIELEAMQRQQREKLMYALGLAYLFVKTILWLSRSS